MFRLVLSKIPVVRALCDMRELPMMIILSYIFINRPPPRHCVWSHSVTGLGYR